MTAKASHAVLADSQLFVDIVDILSSVTGMTGLAGIAPGTRLETDLRMESIELVAFSDELRRRYGDQVDLAGCFATLELEELVEFSVCDVAVYISGLSSLDQHGTNLDGGTPR